MVSLGLPHIHHVSTKDRDSGPQSPIGHDFGVHPNPFGFLVLSVTDRRANISLSDVWVFLERVGLTMDSSSRRYRCPPRVRLPVLPRNGSGRVVDTLRPRWLTQDTGVLSSSLSTFPTFWSSSECLTVRLRPLPTCSWHTDSVGTLGLSSISTSPTSLHFLFWSGWVRIPRLRSFPSSGLVDLVGRGPGPRHVSCRETVRRCVSSESEGSSLPLLSLPCISNWPP